MTAKSNVWRHDFQRLYFKFLNVNLGINLGIDLGKFFVEQAPDHWTPHKPLSNVDVAVGNDAAVKDGQAGALQQRGRVLPVVCGGGELGGGHVATVWRPPGGVHDWESAPVMQAWPQHTAVTDRAITREGVGGSNSPQKIVLIDFDIFKGTGFEFKHPLDETLYEWKHWCVINKHQLHGNY